MGSVESSHFFRTSLVVFLISVTQCHLSVSRQTASCLSHIFIILGVLLYTYSFWVQMFAVSRDYTHGHTHTLGRTPLGEGSARRRGLTSITYNIYNGKMSMPPADFGPSIPVSVRPPGWAVTSYAVYQYRQLCQIGANKMRLARVRTVAISRDGH